MPRAYLHSEPARAGATPTTKPTMKLVNILLTVWLLKGVWSIAVGFLTILFALLEMLWAYLDLAFFQLRQAFISLWRCAFPPRHTRRAPGCLPQAARAPLWLRRLLCFLRLQPSTRTLTLNGGHRICIIKRPGAPGFEIRTEKGSEHLTANAISYLHSEGILESLDSKNMRWD